MAKSTSNKKSVPGTFTIEEGKKSTFISNPGKIYWPDEGYTKKMMVDYYQSIAEYILPFLKNRPESLLRNPNGIKDKGFFHKDAGENAPGFVQSFPVESGSSDKIIDYIICNDKVTLAYLNNLGCIELNPWHSTIKYPDKPDYAIIDIDPSKDNNFDQVVEAALAFKELLDIAGADGYCKTSGSTGLHIYIPLGHKYTYEQAKDFTHLLCQKVEEKLPGFTTLERSLKKRGTKRIYLDYLQNRQGQTISVVYSLRPRPGATVSMPLAWKEVKKGLNPKKFTIKNALTLIKKNPEMFLPVLGKGINMPACLKRLSDNI